VRKEIEPTIWSVAPVSMIHRLWSWEWLDATWKIWEWITEKTECEKSKLFEEKLWLPDIVEKMLFDWQSCYLLEEQMHDCQDWKVSVMPRVVHTVSEWRTVKVPEDEIEYSGCSENSEIQNQNDSLELDVLRKIAP